MKPFPALIKGLKAKAQKIVHLQEALQKDNLRLQEQLTRLKNRVEELEKQNKKLEEQNNVLRISKSVSGSKDSSRSDNEKNLALKLRINELVREIDKCIAQLNR